MIKFPNLSELLEYKNPKVILAFQRDYPQLGDRAEELFESTLKFLWLSRKHEMDLKNASDKAIQFNFVMHEEMREIDSMWHMFMLFTRDYQAFCTKYFGEFLHHEPNMAEAITESPEEFEVGLKRLLSYIYDNLGESSVRSWFGVHISP